MDFHLSDLGEKLGIEAWRCQLLSSHKGMTADNDDALKLREGHAVTKTGYWGLFFLFLSM